MLLSSFEEVQQLIKLLYNYMACCNKTRFFSTAVSVPEHRYSTGSDSITGVFVHYTFLFRHINSTSDFDFSFNGTSLAKLIAYGIRKGSFPAIIFSRLKLNVKV